MKFFFLFFIGLVQYSSLFSQRNNNQIQANQSSGAGQTYAIVVGISRYDKNGGIPQLQYADKDAEVFSAWLKSKAGGSVPENHITLLTNETATYTAIYNALDWLLQTCQKNDLVYFYFSGHGDMENATMFNLGFLLCYNTPRNNYINNAVRIEDLNNFTNTLSVMNNAKVILITDACHSGKLAGSDYRGSYLVGDQLRKVQKSETRIASCASDQLSAEDEGWGGGRGVFSWYLVNGLTGLADKDHHGIVTVNDIRNYLDSSLSADPLLVQKKDKQTPVIKGNDDFKLASVDKDAVSALMKQSAAVIGAPVVMVGLSPLPKQAQTYFFDALSDSKPESVFKFDLLDTVSKDDLPFAFIKNLPGYIVAKISQEKLAELENTLSTNKDALSRFRDKLVEMLSDRGQEIINDYLNGDAAELERRNYYNSRTSGYDAYPKMFSVALKLTNPGNYLYRILEVKKHYFTGVAARLHIPLVKDPKPFEDTAMTEQQQALKLEGNAAYIQNELGILYKRQKKYDAAEQFFLRATQIAPTWVIPWANLVGLYAQNGKFEKGIAAFETAKRLQFDFQNNYINAGILYEKKGNFLYAEELYHKSIELNNKNYLPFERLAFVNMNMTQYAVADSFFFQSENRRNGFELQPPGDLNYIDASGTSMGPPPYDCDIDTIHLQKNNVVGYFLWARKNLEMQKYANAEKIYKALVVIDKNNPLVFHYLADFLYEKKSYQEAEIFFQIAKHNYMDQVAFDHYCDSVNQYIPLKDSCAKKTFRHYYYVRIMDNYYLAKLYESWNHRDKAEQEYRDIILAKPDFIDGYYELWHLYESLGNYHDAEQVINDFRTRNKSDGDKELNAFYARACKKFPTDGEWFYKAGVFDYYLAANDPFGYPKDHKIINAGTGEEEFVTSNIRDIDNPFMEDVDVEDFYYPGKKNKTLSGYGGADGIVYPRDMGINYLTKADSLLQNNDDAVADIDHKIGDLYTWQGLKAKAPKYYKRSIDAKPGNADINTKLADSYIATYQFEEALEQLDSLNRHDETDLPHLLVMAKFYIQSQRFNDASLLIEKAKQLYPFKIPRINELQGKLQLLSGKPKLALPFYMDCLAENPGDQSVMYTIGELYAKMGNTEEAFKWLDMSVKHGFNYSWVLKYDPVWNDYRKLSKWNEITKK